jgi:hypothetical protein
LVACEVADAWVYSIADQKLGPIEDLMSDRFSGQGRYAVLEFGGSLGKGGADRYRLR